MFDRTRDQARGLFFGAWRKYRDGEPLAGTDSPGLEGILLHPEYHAILELPARDRDQDYVGEANPFLHMSLHVALEEQLSIDQPPGIVERLRALVARHANRHDALHEAIECLAETLWRAQRDGAAPDAAAYLECLAKSART